MSDSRVVRIIQGVVGVGSLGGFVFSWAPAVAISTVLVAADALVGVRHGPMKQAISRFVLPRLPSPKHLMPDAEARFTNSLTAAILATASVALFTDQRIVGWTFTAIGGGVAVVTAAAPLCIGCEIYRRLAGH